MSHQGYAFPRGHVGNGRRGRGEQSRGFGANESVAPHAPPSRSHA
ncbi:hypothetical protein RAJCM14343_0007 [Rhodococcus aetherivorans]|uniref:Uncharacterized protein n=1 Tax=Rhodococcus aetherivorans TaxID=191292 RepID=A0ABQ0YE08_9NOCA|nr:hypothetical protein RAJCM14343_0007 [Rhodococcus aetherivorans]